MKTKIEEIIKDNPKHYVRLIKKDLTLHNWVVDNSLVESDNYKEMIYSAITQESNLCKFGKKRSVTRISDGWTGCGPAAVCTCTKNRIAESVKKAKQNVSDKVQSDINDKRKMTMVAKYGYEHNLQRPAIRDKISKPKICDETLKCLNDPDWLKAEYVDKQRSLTDIGSELGVYYGTVGEYCRKFDIEVRQVSNYSMKEIEICNFLDSIGIKYNRNVRNIIGNKEIDIHIPEHNLGIEVNGLYWHSYNPYSSDSGIVENKLRHAEKTGLARDAGIELIQITDNEIQHKKSIIESIIRTRVGKSSVIYARQCKIQVVDKREEREFLDKNHLQGNCHSSVAYGLYYKNELVLMMTFGKSRFSKSADLELLRLCSRLDTIVIGGAERLFKHAISQLEFQTIVSYCDLSKFDGKLYRNLGFTLTGQSSPGYFWTDGNLVISRFKCQSKSLSKWLPSYDSKLSESENMFRANYRRYWDCGQQTWIFNKPLASS